MAENNRNLSIFLLVLALIGAALFYGCGSATSDNIPELEYSITGTYVMPSSGQVPNASARTASGLASGILIYSESDPTNYADIDEAKKRFVINRLKPGKHYIVFRHIGIAGKNYIVRSSKPVELTSASPVKELNEQLVAVEGTIAVSGKITRPDGQLITPTPTLTLWGQSIEVNPFTGEFTTPQMPEGITADLIVKAINYQQNPTPIVFESNPAYYEFKAVETTSTNVPPTVTVSSKRSEYNIKSTVTLTAVAQDANNDKLKFNWHIDSCTNPKVNDNDLEKVEEYQKGSDYTSVYYWNAPEDDCVATISVEVVEEQYGAQALSAKAKLKLQIGTGNYHKNTIPTILNTSIYPDALFGNRTYTVTAIATDTDGDSLTYFLNIAPVTGSSSVILSKSSANTWTWKTADSDMTLSYKLDFEVRDPKGNTASRTMTVDVRASQANNPPVIVSQNPSEEPFEITSGEEQALVIVANDPEKEKLTFAWNSKMGSLKSTSVNNYTASATWVAPYLNNATQTVINCIVSDPYRETAIATFTFNIKPNPDKKAPEITINVVASSSPNVNAPSGVPLLKPNDAIIFTGSAMDINKGVPIDASHLRWEIKGPNDSSFNLFSNASSTATYNITIGTVIGDYIVRMTATDLTGITGEGTTEFRVNALPLVEIICDGYPLENGRANGSPKVVGTYTYNNVNYDAYNYGVASPILTASCTDYETEESALKAAAIWSINGGTNYTGATFDNPTIATGVLNTVIMNARDSKDVFALATATYKFFMNTAPVIELATSTKPEFVNTDLITLNAKIKDDVASLSLAWYVAYKASDTTSYSEYVLLNTIISKDSNGVSINPIPSGNSNTLDSKITLNASDLLGTDRNDFLVKVIATDSMGLQTVNDDIIFSIISPHKLKGFEISSGTYYNNQAPYTFDTLIASEGFYPEFDTVASIAYLEANQIISIRGNCEPENLRQSLTWTWYDSVWVNNNPGNFDTISAFVDPSMSYILNGYTTDKFGTHTIRLEGKTVGGVADTNEMYLFVNSTPQIAFKDINENGTMRFDTGCDATFTITLKEDDPNEEIGLVWTIYDLKQNCEIDESIVPEPYWSNMPKTGMGKPPVYMGGVKEKTINVNWSQITSNKPLEKGAKRVYVCAIDRYGKAATATMDILVNTLPKFIEENNKIINIEVPDRSDNNEDYTAFKNVYTTIYEKYPVYLVAGNPSMQLNYRVDATDAEDSEFFNNHPENIVWTYVDYENGSTITETGKNIKARFGIGISTITVELRDSFYNYYQKNGEYVYNDLCIATCSENFYIWYSYSMEFDDVTGNLPGNALYSLGNNDFYITYGSFQNGVPFMDKCEINAGVNTRIQVGVDTGREGIFPYMELYKRIEDENDPDKVTFESTQPKTKIYPQKDLLAKTKADIITLIRRNPSQFLMLTDSVASYPAGIFASGTENIPLWANYVDNLTEKDTHLDSIQPYSAYEVTTNEDQSTAKAFHIIFDGQIPGNDALFLSRVLSMTYCDDSDSTAGAILLHNWNDSGTTRDAIAAYMNSRLVVDGINTHPLYHLDNNDLRLSDNSKIRYLDNLASNKQKLFITDTNNDRLIRLNFDFAQANSIPVNKPIDVCTTNSKYVFALSESGETGLTLFKIDDNGATPITTFGKILDTNYPDENKRAGKLYNPKSIIYYVNPSSNDNYFGGLMILEEGITKKNRIQLIRSNKADWIE